MSKSEPCSVLDSELHSTLHDRQRRQQRMIDKDDQLRARRYGMREFGRNGRLKYTYNGKVLIWCPYYNRAITSWNLPPRECSSTGGTSHVDPILIHKSYDHTTNYAETAHTLVSFQIRNQHSKWASHTVLVVDMSGSMRTDDVDGARCRSDGVWTCLARDFVQQQIQDRQAGLHDLVSVVLMRDRAEVVIECEPMDYVLYNKLVDLREWAHNRPSGHGNYIPALEQAEILLNKNRSGSCAVSLFFFSDGRPSDANKHELPAKMGALASRFGRRLSVTCVGMANQQVEDFSILEEMVQEAKAFGAIASFNKPSMNADSLSQIITSRVTSSLTATKTELTDLSSGKAMTVRTDLVRERSNAPDDVAPTRDWKLFNNSTRYTVNVWTWNHSIKRGDGGFSRLVDPRCAACYRVHVMDASHDGGQADDDRGMLCHSCKACFFCWNCIKNKMAGKVHGRAQCLSLATERRQGALMPLREHIPSFNVAWKQQCFGEGAERVAFKFRYLDNNGKFMGPKMVAKESRFVDHDGIQSNDAKDYLTTNQHQYHMDFMRTQFLASRFANKYNAVLDEWEEHLDDLSKKYSNTDQIIRHQQRIRKFPRIKFLQPRIFELVDKDTNKTFNVLVEHMIEGEYRKYNNNNGGLAATNMAAAVPGMSPVLAAQSHGLNPDLVYMLLGIKASDNNLASATSAQGTAFAGNIGGGGLGAITEEDSEEGDESGDDDSVNQHHGRASQQINGQKPDDRIADEEHIEFFDRIVHEGEKADRKLTNAAIPDEDFMQAFSHFSFVRSAGRMIIVDLQGTLQTTKEGRREFVLTDPAIHKRAKSKYMRTVKFGRTDRGDRGIKDFFATHTCNDACRLLGVRPYEKKNPLLRGKQQEPQEATIEHDKQKFNQRHLPLTGYREPITPGVRAQHF